MMKKVSSFHLKKESINLDLRNEDVPKFNKTKDFLNQIRLRLLNTSYLLPLLSIENIEPRDLVYDREDFPPITRINVVEHLFCGESKENLF